MRFFGRVGAGGGVRGRDWSRRDPEAKLGTNQLVYNIFVFKKL